MASPARRQPCAASGAAGLHGGHSTGPRTPEGRERIRQANTKHGLYSSQVSPIKEVLGFPLTRRFREYLSQG